MHVAVKPWVYHRSRNERRVFVIIEVRHWEYLPSTPEDHAVWERIPSWLRSDYKIADRTAAEQMFACVDAREETQAT